MITANQPVFRSFLNNISIQKEEVNVGHGGRRNPSEYITIKAEVFYDTSQRKNGVRPCIGQPFPQNMKIECAKEIRNYPIGTKVKLDVVETEKEGSRPFLYSSYKWKHYVIDGL